MAAESEKTQTGATQHTFTTSAAVKKKKKPPSFLIPCENPATFELAKDHGKLLR